MAVSRPTIHLWDIDGTLVSSGGAGRRAMVRAFVEVLGDERCGDFNYGGMTDRFIVRTAYERAGRSPSEADIDALLARYLEHLADEVPVAPYKVMPGIMDALDATIGQRGVATGLGTGNVRRGAHLKLSRVGLHERFSFGGFGCDHEGRAELLACGADRGARELGVPRQECRVVVIGDTPRDVEAARAIGAECVGVATGGFDAASLREAGADFVFADLREITALSALLG